MQQLADLIEHEGDRRPRLVLGGAVGALQHRLCELEVPVAEDVPDEAVGRARRLVELVEHDALRDLVDRFRRLAEDPAVERLIDGARIEPGRMRAGIHLREARRVPDLGREVAVALDALDRELDVAPLRRHGGEREAQRVGAVAVDQLERIDDVALRLRHFRPALVAHQGVDVDVAERHLLHEMETEHHHPGDPEEDDVEAGDERARRIIALQLRRLVGPAERRERPQAGGEPGVEDVLVADKIAGGALRIARERPRLIVRHLVLDDGLGERLGQRLVLALGDVDTAVGRIPGRDLMSPPQLARDAPGLDVLEPLEIGLLPVLRDEAGLAGTHRRDRALGQGLDVDVPLVGQIGLDRHARAVAVRHHVDVRLDLLEEPVLLEHRDDALARLEAVEVVEAKHRIEIGAAIQSVEKRVVAGKLQPRFRNS